MTQHSDLTLFDLLTATGGRLVAGGTLPSMGASIDGVVIDSRKAVTGSLFWALPGSRFDGADFVEDAWRRGAIGVVAQKQISDAPADRWLLRVEDSLAALWRLAEWKRRQFSGRTIAVTGSVGKSTTRQMIHTILSDFSRCIASPANYNNHTGLPLSMLGLSASANYAVLELAASGEGEIARLARLCAPQIGVITGIAEAHLGGFGGITEIAEAKAELLASLPEEGVAIMNGDCEPLRRATAGHHGKIVWFGRNADCDLVATKRSFRSGLLRFECEGEEFRIPVQGRHYLYPALAAIAACRSLGFAASAIAKSLLNFQTLPMRCQVQRFGQYTVINDSYNACPTAMAAALDLLRDFDEPGRRVVISGDMCDLGPAAGMFHRQLGDEMVTRCGADLLIACGDRSADVTQGALAAGMPGRNVRACKTVDEVQLELSSLLAPGDVILLKGSRAIAMERLLTWFQTQPERIGNGGREQLTLGTG